MSVSRFEFYLVLLLSLLSLVCADDNWRNVTGEFSGTFPDARFQFEMGVSSDKKSAILFGGRAAGWWDFFNDTHVMDLVNMQWKTLPNSAQVGPPARFLSGDFIYGDSFYIFGGSTYIKVNESFQLQPVFNDTYRFNFNNNSWSVLPNATISPEARYGFAMQVIGNKAYLFGGKENCITHDAFEVCPPSIWMYEDQFNDTWVLNIDTMEWSQILTETAPSPRYMTASFAYDGKFFVFGGRHVQTQPEIAKLAYNDLWKFDPNTNEWSEVNISGELPAIRYDAAYTIYEDKFYVFGGYVNGTWGDDTWEYDITNNRWRELEATVKPSKREGSNGVVYEGIWFLFGGKLNKMQATEVAYDDVWILNLTSMRTETSSDESSSSSASFFSLSISVLLFAALLGSAAVF